MLRFFGLRFGPRVGSVLIRFLFWSCKKHFIIDESLHALQTPMVVVFWHGEMIFQPFLYEQIREKPNGRVIISHHADGEIAARTIAFFDLKAIRGSTSRGAIRVLLQAFSFLKKGEDLAITPDGPRGPYHNIADGIVAITQKNDYPVVIFRLFAKRCWHLSSWDRFMIPKPFTEVHCIAMPPLSLKNHTLESAKVFLKEQMERDLQDYLKG